jgi:hypothetical protein
MPRDRSADATLFKLSQLRRERRLVQVEALSAARIVLPSWRPPRLADVMAIEAWPSRKFYKNERIVTIFVL